jgi:hypothetical protein
MLTENDGMNTCLAHNGSGYDTRLVFEEVMKIASKGAKIKPIMKGGKFMRLSVNKTLFQDTMLHLVGSLKDLAESYLKDSALQLKKGHFPHLFNKVENRNYVGPLPDKNMFDLSFSIKTDKDMTDFHAWHDEYTESGRDWNFQENLESYCINDVNVLAEIVRLHHNTCVELLGNYKPHLAISPWHSPTAAGYVHKLFLREISEEMNVEDILQNDTPEVKEAKALEAISKAQDTWCALVPNEYYFCRESLRGGRTEIMRHYYEGPIINIDVQSMYPSLQMAKSIMVCGEELKLYYPVGTPSVTIFEEEAYPCRDHFKDPCTCTLQRRMENKHKQMTIRLQATQPDHHEYIKDFFGIISIDATPPVTLRHAVLPIFKDGKCLFSLEPIVKQTFTSEELKLAIRMGYKVTKIYRSDRYNHATSKWGGLLGEMYKLKLYNSQKAEPNAKNILHETTPEWQARQKKTYKDKFNIDITFDAWDEREASKATGKVLMNSAWGKHAESVDHPQAFVSDGTMNQENYNFYQSIDEKSVTLKNFIPLAGDHTLFKYDENRENAKPDLHKGYLPAAVFVPAYGRMMLYNMLYQAGDDAIMVDTDSIKIADTPTSFKPVAGDCLGDWEHEKGDLIEFVSLGPKTYGQHYSSYPKKEGHYKTFKCKGLNLKRGHKNLMNFDIAVKILKEDMKGRIPQFSMDYSIGQKISARKYIKQIQFQPHLLKGDYDPVTYTVTPYGYKPNIIN